MCICERALSDSTVAVLLLCSSHKSFVLVFTYLWLKLALDATKPTVSNVSMSSLSFRRASPSNDCRYAGHVTYETSMIHVKASRLCACIIGMYTEKHGQYRSNVVL